MEGITILNQTEIMRLPILYYFAFPMLIGTILIAAIVCCVFIEEGTWFAIMPAGLVVLSLYLLVNLIGNNPLETTGRYEYEVLLSEDVSFTELYERYEIIEQRGEIWVLRDKEE